MNFKMYIVNKVIMLRIGGKAIRGIKGSRNAICENFRNIDVTSGSRAKIGKWSGRDFSPLVGILEKIRHCQDDLLFATCIVHI